jgi:hypothetical protein
MITIEVTSPPNAAPDLIDAGVAVATRMVRPAIYTAHARQIALNFPMN